MFGGGGVGKCVCAAGEDTQKNVNRLLSQNLLGSLNYIYNQPTVELQHVNHAGIKKVLFFFHKKKEKKEK